MRQMETQKIFFLTSLNTVLLGYAKNVGNENQRHKSWETTAL